MFVSLIYLSLFMNSGLSVVVLQSGDQISPPGVTVTLECRMGTESMSSYTMLWYRQNHHGAEIQFLQKEYGEPDGHFESFIDANKNNFSLQITELIPNDTSTYYCAASHSDAFSSVLFDIKMKRCANYEAYFGQGTKLTVLEQDHEVKSPTVKILPPSDNECRKKKRSKRKKTLVCVASGFYPDHVSVSWNIDGQSVTDGVATDSAAVKKDKFYTVTSRLTVPAEAWFNPQTVFNCTVNFFNGSSNNPYSDSISSNKKDKGIGREKYLHISQNAKLSYVVLIVKSCLYGVFVCFVIWKLQSSRGKQNK
ncbi:T cell receptor beta chain MC.7.G5 [Kryptolebias marmoratus]|uniref:T cell receptor beta chain MC.7.G5 n=1 Tax=Kryptolebias marmoratus TaxID=37003 RepID=UPI000D52F779|nr:T cell receptor beta chain MC.7.G5 [Kryptolebias marmoratus]